MVYFSFLFMSKNITIYEIELADELPKIILSNLLRFENSSNPCICGPSSTRLKTILVEFT